MVSWRLGSAAELVVWVVVVLVLVVAFLAGVVDARFSLDRSTAAVTGATSTSRLVLLASVKSPPQKEQVCVGFCRSG